MNNKDLSPALDYEMNESGDITRLTVPYNEALLSLQFAALEIRRPIKFNMLITLKAGIRIGTKPVIPGR
ncbi:hypothetical protein KRR40_17240 [Niabella defluvii]|nr:hypothetical protein KRR40_17240 [Niabella sp. I65]